MVHKHHQNNGFIITQTPFRLSFFGGGTDFPSYFNEKEGVVIGAAIQKYVYVSLNLLERFFDKKISLSYHLLEKVDSPSELKHDIIRTVLTNSPFINEESFVDIHTFADLPSSSGIGSSSSFTVGMLLALNALKGSFKNAEQLSKEAIHIERNLLKDAGGWQDQIFAAYGGLQRIRFNKDGFVVDPLCLTKEKELAFEDSLMFFFTGDTRSSAKIQESVIINTDSHSVSHRLDSIYKNAVDAYEILKFSSSNTEMIYELGRLMHKSWEEKKNLASSVSNEKIDSMYEKAIKAGALGGKISGAGGGGFMMFIVPPERQDAVREALADYRSLKIQFEHVGARVCFSKF